MYFHNYTPFSLTERIPRVMNTPLPNMGKVRFLFHDPKTRGFIREFDILSSLSVTSNL